MDDVLTQPWFIVLLGLILAIMMLSFGAMVFVKRKHMLMKQSALGTIRGELFFILHFLFIVDRSLPRSPSARLAGNYLNGLTRCTPSNNMRAHNVGMLTGELCFVH